MKYLKMIVEQFRAYIQILHHLCKLPSVFTTKYATELVW